MYLSRLDVFGFKSFAQKVDLKFTDGISAVIGPNGCGKSNIVDAIRWVIGEQKASILRSDVMENVIFNGSKYRKPLGMAEVSLVIQNTKGILPTEYSEVVISRRLYRSGESEYLLNKVPCRLKDITNLFMDTGMGSNAYSVIELKMIEDILSESPEDRRRMFEEAAGITKYKHRRKAAVRKLEQTQQELVRVRDIVNEIEKNVNSLKRQVQKAERYQQYIEALKNEEIQLARYEYSRAHAEMKPMLERMTEWSSENGRLYSELTSLESEFESYQTSYLALDQQLKKAQQVLELEEGNIREQEKARLIAMERKEAKEKSIARGEMEKDGLSQRREQLLEQKINAEKFVHNFTSTVEIIQNEYRSAETKFNGIQTLWQEKQYQYEEIKKKIVKSLLATGEKASQGDRLKSQQIDIQTRISQLKNKTETLQQKIKSLQNDMIDTKVIHHQIQEQLNSTIVDLGDKNRKQNEYTEELARIHSEKLSIQGKIETTQTKIQFVAQMLDQQEGFSKGIKFLEKEKQTFEGIHGTLSEVVHTKKEFRRAIEAGLQEVASFVIADNTSVAGKTLSYLRENRKGRVTFIPLDRIKKFQLPKPSVILSSSDGIIGWAADVAECADQFRPMINLFLSDVVLVNDLDTAIRWSDFHRTLKFVTMNGEVVGSGARYVQGGSDEDTGGIGLVGRKDYLSQLNQEIEYWNRELNQLTGDNQTNQDGLNQVQTEIRELTDQIESLKDKSVSTEKIISQKEYEVRTNEESVQKQNDEIHRFEEELDNCQNEFNRFAGEFSLIEAQKSHLEEEASVFEKELDDLTKTKDQQSLQVRQFEVKLININNENTNRENEWKRALHDLAEIETTLNYRKEEIQSWEDEVRDLQRTVMSCDENIQSLVVIKIAAEEKRNEFMRLYQDQRQYLFDREEQIKNIRKNRDEVVQNLRDFELRLSEMRIRSQNLRDRIFSDFQFELIVEENIPDIDVAEAKKRIDDLKIRIKYLGPVNLEALDEYTKESERFNFLTQQKSDLEQAIATLNETIIKINETARYQFLDTFEKIRQNFQKTFTDMFETGDAEIRLTEGEDPIEADIEIMAKPKGKRIQSLMLMSGGEKTLTAIALLFAIYLVKPSPFCILDEVDAPLDDVNIGRFTRVLKKFSLDTQFIVVTHNKRTMEAADCIYGVTMEEEGISKIVSVKFE